MHARTPALLALALLVATAGCDLEPRPKKKRSQPAPAAAAKLPVAKDTAQPKALPTRPTPTPVPSGVRAPTRADLTRYTRGLKGKGKLMARIATTMGAIDCELFPDKAPIAVANFVGLARGLHPFFDPKTKQVARRPYYDGLIFHRVIPNFMIQTGDPLGLGVGGPGYKFPLEAHKDLKHGPGALSMARPARDKNGNGSQFFITERRAPNLDGGYSLFGRCNNVDSVVKRIARVEKDPSDRTRSRPKTPVKINKVSIFLGPGVAMVGRDNVPAERPRPARR